MNENANAKHGTNGLPRQRKSKMWQIGLRPSQLKSASPRWRSEEIWEEWVSNEREGRKNPRLHYFYGIFCFALVIEWRQMRWMGAKTREREERTVDRLGFSCGNFCFALVTDCRKMRGMGTKWEKGRMNGRSPRVFLWEAQYLILHKTTGSVSARAEMGCWCGWRGNFSRKNTTGSECMKLI